MKHVRLADTLKHRRWQLPIKAFPKDKCCGKCLDTDNYLMRSILEMLRKRALRVNPEKFNPIIIFTLTCSFYLSFLFSLILCLFLSLSLSLFLSLSLSLSLSLDLSLSLSSVPPLAENVEQFYWCKLPANI